ncbi:MAG: hypothetical protein RMZ41_003215 [Nostoc sp. DedVER02]|uniref:hypothetical protein n=1 Tax=unclassified Nostoc TaxID=2593658 RepID=UPI002AD4FEAB|nr:MULTISPECIES: hypothetical protein [unclassified Nostoc]MDZ7986834.1 hypothetical protein [Nostoc sp. DedVER02]MDZ8115736.1 hypothetical protein [Nostoc sp. DedVER01b]
MDSIDETAQPSPPGGIDPRELPSCSLDNRATLPRVPAIYFCLGADDQILYIDCTVNLNQKWIANQQHTHLAAIPNVRIAWLLVDEPEELQNIKQAMIDHWEPQFNNWRYKLRLIEDLTIDGWHDFQKVQGIWAIYRDAVMPTPAPKEIADAYRKVMRDKAREFKKVEAQERRQRIEQLRTEIQELENQGFVPPAGCHLSTYKVKRPYGTYEYWKLWSHHPVFPMRMSEGQKAFWQSQGKDYHKDRKVKTMHLGIGCSTTYNLAVQGLQTRKRIEALQRQIEILLSSLDEE